MAEYKQYITQIQENGNVMISEDVIATIVAQTLTEVEGVASIKPADLGKKNKGMKIQIHEDNTLVISVNVSVVYGHSVVEVATAVQQAVTGSVESMTGVKVNEINVNVSGIVRQ